MEISGNLPQRGNGNRNLSSGTEISDQTTPTGKIYLIYFKYLFENPTDIFACIASLNLKNGVPVWLNIAILVHRNCQ